ncbi:MAG: hypothetical protein NTV51_07890 [Verrucomicrobia bacterium]|nr:hypothetical protein [Verrucomicrobiota bacterium]
MPEALAVVAVFVIAVVIYAAMWLRSRDPSLNKPHEELVRLRHHTVWLEERLARARRENWGHEMVVAIEGELRASVKQLSKAEATGAPQTEPVGG